MKDSICYMLNSYLHERACLVLFSFGLVYYISICNFQSALQQILNFHHCVYSVAESALLTLQTSS